jgi:hypothetical protein
MLALLHYLFQFSLVISKQNMNPAVRFVADGVNLRTKLLPGRCWILIKKSLNPVVVLHKQRPNLLLLFPSQLQIFREMGKFLIDRLRSMDVLKLLSRTEGCCAPVPSAAWPWVSPGQSIPSMRISAYTQVKVRFSMGSNLLQVLRRNPGPRPHLINRALPQRLRLRAFEPST